MQPTTRSRPTLLIIMLIAGALVLAMWAWQNDRNSVDVNTDNLVTELCQGTPDC